MTGDPTLELIDSLSTDLAPVRRVPSLMLAVAVVLAAGGLVLVCVVLLHGGRFDHVASQVPGSR